jgi:putative Holliday junction resolvase
VATVVVDRRPSAPAPYADLLALVERYRPIEIVVGLPRSLSGAEGPAAVRIRAAAAAFAAALVGSGHAVPVRLVDERLTTVHAARQLRAAGRSAKKQRAVIDSAAATGILEHALAVEGAGGTPPGQLVSPAERPPVE